MSYYDVSTGFFPVPVKACFSKREFHKILKQHGIPLTAGVEAAPLERGVAETHTFSGCIDAMIVVVYDLNKIMEDLAGMAGVIAHESSHVVERILEYVGEQVEDFGEETRAYLMQYLVEQMYHAALLEISKYAKRKGNRTKTDEGGETSGGIVSEVGKSEYDGSTGQDRDSPEDISGRVKGSQGKAIRKAKSSNKSN